MRILVTGADGFVGANLVAELARSGHAAVAVHRRPFSALVSAGLRAAGGVLPEFATCDVADSARVAGLFARFRPSHVVHAAAVTPDAQTEIEAADRVLATNELGTLAVLTAAARHGAERVLVVSSSGVYAGGDAATLLDEDAALCQPCGLYAVTKLGVERLCDWAAYRFGLDTRVVRLGPVYGPFERPTGSRRNMSAVLVALELALAGQPLRCLAPQYSRDWIHGRDAARAIAGLLLSSSLSHRLYNLGGEAIAMERLLQAVAAAVPGTSVEWVDSPDAANVPSTAAPDAFRNMDTGRLRQDVGFRPTIGIDEGIRDTADWLRADHTAGQAPGATGDEIERGE